MSTIVIGFGHKARHGKDTAVAAILEAYKDKYDIRRCAFADELKRECNEAMLAAGGFDNLLVKLRAEAGLPDWVKLDDNPDMTDPLCPHGKHRALLQWWGTEYRRAKDPNYWVKKMDDYIKREKPQIALIPDMRFPNELYFVKSFKNNGWTVRVTRHNYNDPNMNNEHPSEKALNGYEFDALIDVNDGEVEVLKKNALELMEIILNTYKVNESELDFSIKN